MAVSLHSRSVRWLSVAAFAGALLAGCGEPMTSTGEITPPETPVKPPPPPEDDPIFNPGPAVVECDSSISVSSNSRALIVRDPAVLEVFTLERVLAQLIARFGSTPSPVTPDELLKRLFDTQNTAAGAAFADNVHCDSVDNKAFKNAAAVGCPRAEGALAKSEGLFTPGHKDYFYPVALVNRLDLMTKMPFTCGEHRIVFAKWSGRTDPNDRVFLIFEGALQNPFFGNVMGCWPVAKFWSGLQATSDPVVLKDRLEGFYFTGLSGFQPVIDPIHFSLKAPDNEGYGHQSGQVRLSQHMEDPWDMREFRLALMGDGLSAPPMAFAPATVKNSPVPGFFDPSVQTPMGETFRSQFHYNEMQDLAAADLKDIRMRTTNIFNAGESSLEGAAGTNYLSLALSSGDTSFLDSMDMMLVQSELGKDCPPDDPLNAEAILARASMLSCAGCHAPAKFLGPERKIGCGLVWPSTMGEVHIDEKGMLSEALTDVFMPRRASVLQTFAQACDMEAISANLLPAPPNDFPK
jgi:hypothetical protein